MSTGDGRREGVSGKLAEEPAERSLPTATGLMAVRLLRKGEKRSSQGRLLEPSREAHDDGTEKALHCLLFKILFTCSFVYLQLV